MVLTVSGRGRLSTPLKGSQAPLGGVRTFSVRARLLADGTARGKMRYNQTSEFPFNVYQEGIVTCVNDIGSGIIFIAAHGTERVADADPAAFLGLPPAVLPDDDGMVFALRDNGEGDDDRDENGSAPDQITAVAHTLKAVADAVCANPAQFGFTEALAEAFFNDIEAGDIKVEYEDDD